MGINVIYVEDYLISVIFFEMSVMVSLELLKVYVVILRSWLLVGFFLFYFKDREKSNIIFEKVFYFIFFFLFFV